MPLALGFGPQQFWPLGLWNVGDRFLRRGGACACVDALELERANCEKILIEGPWLLPQEPLESRVLLALGFSHVQTSKRQGMASLL